MNGVAVNSSWLISVLQIGPGGVLSGKPTQLGPIEDVVVIGSLVVPGVVDSTARRRDDVTIVVVVVLRRDETGRVVVVADALVVDSNDDVVMGLVVVSTDAVEKVVVAATVDGSTNRHCRDGTEVVVC